MTAWSAVMDFSLDEQAVSNSITRAMTITADTRFDAINNGLIINIAFENYVITVLRHSRFFYLSFP